MGKKVISIIIMLLLFSTSCNTSKNDNATIQVWCYAHGDNSNEVDNILTLLRLYSSSKNIPIEIVKYDEKILAYDDYVLKRNAAMANGNMITIDRAQNLQDIAKYHADYSRVENYNKLLEPYKDKFCIPLGVGYMMSSIENEVLDKYGINIEKNLILYSDYLEIKQQLKQKGAKFKVTERELTELVDYYLIKNNLRYLNGESKIIKDTKRFKEAMKKSIIEIYEDFKLYNGDYVGLNSFFNATKISEWNQIIYDESSDLVLTSYEGVERNRVLLTRYDRHVAWGEEILNKTFYLTDDIFNSSCVYMHKKITNGKIYDVFNQFIDDSNYRSLNEYKSFSPVHNTESVKKYLTLDENWRYDGDFNVVASINESISKVIDLINGAFEMVVKNKETAKIVASYVYENKKYYSDIFFTVRGTAYNMLKEKLDYNSKQVNDMLNNTIDEFITNFNVHYN